jgi:general stress protein 26
MSAHSTDTTRSLDRVLEGQRFAMVTTAGPRGLRSRPLTLLEHEDAVLRFLVSKQSEWVQDVADQPMASVQVSFADPHDNIYVALQGHATIDEAKDVVTRLWNPAAEAFFAGPDDPDAVALECAIHDGEWWDGPSTRVGMVISLVKRAVTGDSPGQSGSVDPEA